MMGVKNQSGLVIGWRNTIQPQQKQHWVVVAGILPMKKIICRTEDESNLVLTKLQSIFDHLGTRSCFCCSGNCKEHAAENEEDGGGGVCLYCSGCIRRVCFEHILVLGYFSNNTKEETTGLPSSSSIPPFSFMETKQVLIYDPNDTVYCHNNNRRRMCSGGCGVWPNSYVLLAQLTHARAVMEDVRNAWNNSCNNNINTIRTFTNQYSDPNRKTLNHKTTTTTRTITRRSGSQPHFTNSLPTSTATTTSTCYHQPFFSASTAINKHDETKLSVTSNDHHPVRLPDNKTSIIDFSSWKSCSLLIQHWESPVHHHGWMARYEMCQCLWNILIAGPDDLIHAGVGRFNNCDVCGNEQRWESHYESVTRQIEQANRHLLVLIDSILGAVWAFKIAWTIFHQKDMHDNKAGDNLTHENLETSAWTLPWFLKVYDAHYQFLFDGIEWLGRFPIGLKLNERLTESVGREIERMWAIHKIAFQKGLVLSSSPSSWRETILVPKIIGIGIIFVVGLSLGATGLLALCHDVMRLLTLHISILAWCTHEVYRWELYLLAALWRLFRGKKRNVLRQRTDTMEYDSMQLLLGTLLFAVSLFLFTTIFVYQVYFSALYLLTFALSVPFAFIRSAILVFPWAHVTVRYLAPSWLTKEVYIRECDYKWKVDVTRICCRPLSYGSIVSSNLVPTFASLFSCLIAFVIQSLSGSMRLSIDVK
jgi:hypothetical protein